MADTSKTERSTPKKKRDSRERGEVARSTELSSSLNLLAAFAAIAVASGWMTQVLGKTMRQGLTSWPLQTLDPGEWFAQLSGGLGQSLLVIAPVFLAVFLMAVGANYLQVGFQVAGEALEPKWQRLDPVQGFRRIFSGRGLVELLKAVVKIGITGVLAWQVLKHKLPVLIQLGGSPLAAQVAAAGSLLAELGIKLGLFFLALGVLDFIWQRFDFEQKLRMTKQEVRDEMRQTEGDPMIKYKRRARHRRLVSTRMAAEVAKADVITTNPTHYAVALRYDQRRMRAPRVVAKGQRLWAKLIVRIARAHYIPIVENKLVTRAIYHQVEVGQEIPPTLYKAVAEILAALYKLRKLRGRAK